MKKLWAFCRRCAAYLVRQHLSLFDILLMLTFVRQLDQHQYEDAVLTLFIGSIFAVLLKELAGKYATGEAVITNVVHQTVAAKPDPGFAKRVQESFK